MNPPPTITAIIPTTGRATLARAVDSVLSQVWPVKELLLIYDAAELPLPLTHSPSFTPSLPIRLLHTGGGRGASHARNLGAAHATGTHLAFLDDDDYWLDHHLHECFTTADLDWDFLCTGVMRLTAGALLPTALPPVKLIPQNLFVSNPGVRGSNLIVATDTYRAIGGFDPALPSSNDLDFAIRLLDHGARYRAVLSRTVVFRQHHQPRLSTPGSPAKRAGLLAFWNRYHTRMSRPQKLAFKRQAKNLWRCRDLEFVECSTPDP